LTTYLKCLSENKGLSEDLKKELEVEIAQGIKHGGKPNEALAEAVKKRMIVLKARRTGVKAAIMVHHYGLVDAAKAAGRPIREDEAIKPPEKEPEPKKKKEEDPHWAAVGVASGHKVDQLEKKFIIGWADKIGPVKKGTDLYFDVVGTLGGGRADRFFAKGLSVRRKTIEEPQLSEKAVNSGKLADWVVKALAPIIEDPIADYTITWRELFKKADQFFGGTQAEGTYTPRDAYDALELGVNRYILKYLRFTEGPNNIRRTPESIIQQLKDLVEYLPTQSKRTKEQVDYQQFSTPPFLAYVANWVAAIGSNDTYLEPSAGIGGLAIFGRMTNVDEIYTNELSERRRELLKLLNISKEVFGEDAIQLDNILPDHVKPTVVVMNPPFSSTAGRLKRNATAYGAQHVEQALNRLEPGGRLVAIVGRGMEMNAPTFRKWWTDIRKKYNVRANIGISGDEYRKYGTTFNNRIIIIDKSGPTSYDPIVADVETVSELPDLLRGIRNDRPKTAKPDQESESDTVQPPLPEPSDKGEGTPPGPPPSRPESSDLGDKDGGDQADADIGEPGTPPEQPPGTHPGPRGNIPGPGQPPETGGAPETGGHPPGGAPRSGDGESEQLSPETPGDLSLDDISDIFDDVVDELEKEKTETQPPQTPEPGPPLGPMGGPPSTPQPGPKPPSKGGYGDIADLINNATNKVKSPQAPYGDGKEPATAPLILPEIYERAKAKFSEQYVKFMEGAKDLKERAHAWMKDALRGLIANGVTDINIAKNWVLHFYANDRPDLEPPSTKKASAPGELDLKKAEKEVAEIKAALYQRYVPTVKIKGAKKHPTQLDESAALGDTVPPKATYKPRLPQKMIDDGKTSDAQLEFVVYAGQAHDGILPSGERRGIFAGHGTGVGKGRIIAAIILDNWNRGRKKAIWISEKAQLFNDAKRDMGYDPARKIESGIGWGEGADNLFWMKTKLGDTIPDRDGIMFTTYATLRSNFDEVNEREPSTYDNMRVRINQIVKWAGKDYDGVIAFDESHNMSNSLQQQTDRGTAEASAMARAGVMLQKRLPNARIVYVSATGATEVRNLAYAERLGLWGEGTAFPNKQAFVTDITSRGLSAMELVARDLKSRGLYLAPTLSYDGVNHDKLVHKLDKQQRKKYDELAGAWRIVLHNIHAAMAQTGQENAQIGNYWSVFWGGQQRFFNQLITTMQMGSGIKHMEKQLAKGKALVLQLVNHGGDQLVRALAARDQDSELEDLDLGPKAALLDYIERAFPTQQFEPYVDASGNDGMRPVVDSQGNPVINREAERMKQELIQRIAAIDIPGGPLDMIIHHFGADKVAEVTGRKVRLIYDENGELVEDRRSEAKVKKDVEAFLDDEKQILVFSEKGGTGVSYHADLDRINQRKRVHYLVQPGWRADKAIQGLGRTHRSNQKQPPEYFLLTTDLDAQKRFISSIARRLDQLGSLTKGQRQTGSQGIFQARDNMESGYAASALQQLYRNIVDGTSAISTEDFQDQTALTLVDDDGNLLTALPPATQFMNRLLSMEIGWQNKIFKEWADRIDVLIDAATAAGTLDVGIETIQALNIVKTDDRTVHTDKASGAKTRYIRLDITTPSNRKPFEDLINVEKYYVNLRSGKIWGATPTRTMTSSSGNVTSYRSLISPAGTVQRVAVESLGAQQGELFEEPWELDEKRPWGHVELERYSRKKGTDAQYRIEDNETQIPSDDYRDYVIQHFVETTKGGDGLEFRYSGQEEIDGKIYLVFDPKEALRPKFFEITRKAEAAERWNKLYAETSSTTTRDSHLMTGALLPIWDRLGGASTVHRLQTDDGERFLGLVIPHNNIDFVLTNLGATKDAKDYTGKELVKDIMDDNATVYLANRWKIKKKTVSGDERIEVFGPDYDDFDNLERWGIIIETIAHKTRYFIPTGDNAAAAMNNVIRFSTVTNVSKPYAGPTLTNTTINEPKDINKLFGHPKQVQIKMFGGNQLNIFTDQPKAKAKGEKGPELPEPRQVVTLETTGDISHYGTKVRSAEEAAGLLSFLLRKGAEEAYTVAVDKDSNVVQIHKISKGAMSSAPVPVLESGGTLLKAPGATKVYFIHQHPSGHPEPSAEDHQIAKLIASVAGMRGIEVQAVVMADHPPVYVVFDPEDDYGTKTYGRRPLTPELRKRVKKNLTTKLPVGERFITPVRGYDTGTLAAGPSNSVEAIRYFKQLYHDMEGIMLLSAKNEDLGFLPWGKGENEKEFTARIIDELDRHNALAMIINLKSEHGDHTLTKARTRYLKALVKRARWFGATVHEVLVDDVSMADPGIIAKWRSDAALEQPDFFASLINEKNILFSRKVSRPKDAMTREAVQEHIDPILSEMKTRPGVTVLAKQAGLPPGVKTYLKEQGATNDIVVAAVFESRVYLVAENIEDRHEAVRALLHEVMGHFGIRSILGDQLDSTLDRVYMAKRAEISAIATEYGFDLKTKEGRRAAADEWLAREAQTNPDSKWIDRVIAMIRKWLREINPNLKFSDAEIRALLASARQYVRTGQPASVFPPIAFDRMPALADMWYSHMAAKVEKSLPESGTASSYLKALNQMAKSGKIKSEELEWSGAREWLRTQKGKIAKTDLLSLLDKNNVKLEEINYYTDPRIIANARLSWPQLTGDDYSTTWTNPVDNTEHEIRITRDEAGQWFALVDEFNVGEPYSEADARGAAEDAVDAMIDDAIGEATELTWIEEPEGKWSADWHDTNLDMDVHFNIESWKNPTRRMEYTVRVNGEETVTYNSLPEAKLAVKNQVEQSVEEWQHFTGSQEARPYSTEPKHAEWQMPGGQDYRELLLTLPGDPKKAAAARSARVKSLIARRDKYKAQHEKAETSQERQELTRHIENTVRQIDMMMESTEDVTAFRHIHWQADNVVSHVRFNERIDVDGKKVLFLEEVQSDWHQKGRREGYQQKKLSPDEKAERIIALRDKAEAGNTTLADQEEMNDLVRDKAHGAPDAPFKKSWPMLIMKRMVRYAAENDFDSISWTPGKFQNKRYSLSRKVERIEVAPRTDAVTGLGDVSVAIILKSGPQYAIDLGVNNAGLVDNSSIIDFKGKPLADIVGKDVAKRIVEMPNRTGVIKGINLDMGGKPMIEFYDKILPNQLNKLFGTKAWGKARVKVTKIELTGQKTEGDETRPTSFKSLSDVTSALSLPITPEMKAKALYEGMPLFMKKQGSIDVVGRLPEEVKHRFAQARGVPKQSWIESVKEKIDFVKSQKHHFPDLYTIGNIAEEDKLADVLRQHQEVPESAKDQAARKVLEFTRNLTQDQYEVFRIHVILSDMMRDIDTELLTDRGLKEGETLPFGFKSVQEIKDTFETFDQLADQAPSIRKAISDRRNYINGLVKEMVKYKVLKKEVLKHKDYFHHQVLSYWAGKKMQTVGTSSADVRTHWRPWMVARKGSMLDYNTEYVEAEFAALSQQLAQIETARTLERVKNISDIYSDLKTAAKFENLKNFYVQAAKNLSALYKQKITVAEIHQDPTKLDPLFPYRQNIAMAGAGLEKMAHNGDLNVTSEWDDVVDALAEKHTFKKLSEEEQQGASELGDISDARYFAFLSYLVGRGLPGSNWAATIFKAIQGRNKTIKGYLGDDFVTYQQLIPENYTEWKPTPGKGWFWTNTIADDILQKIIAGEKALEDKDVRQALARGRDLIWVVPKGLASTMDNFRRYPDANSLGRVADWSLSAWKMWILINPRRWVRYNVNNMSGDLDVSLAYAPGIATPARMSQALKDLIKWQGRKELSPSTQAEIDNARRKGVIGSGFAVQEVEDVLNIMSMDKFVRNVLLGEKPNIAMRYWNKAKGSTVLRENILRLAAYRWFREQLKAGNAVYGASKVHEIDNIKDMDDRAAKLARELIGDYGNISSAGQYIRRRLIPFYSWLEINAPRYVYLMRNLKSEDRHSDAADLRKRVAGILSAKVAMGAGKLFIKANLLMGMVTLWNMLVHRDEWEELGEAKRRQMHLILGRREDGTIMTIRFQGALSDALSFFGLEDWPADIADVMKGTSTIADKLIDAPKALVNRAIQGIRPEPKLLFESSTGYRTYPDVFSPRPIRDRVENVLRTFSLDSIYRMAAGKPGRGKNMAEHFISDITSLLVYTSDPGEQAYYDTRKVVFDWLGDQGIERASGRPTNRSNALYYYRQALKYGDLTAAKKYLEKYYTYPGATGKTLRKSIKRAHPLTSIPARRRFTFRESLTAEQANRLKIALKWYEKTYKEKDTEFRHGPPAKQTVAK
jgi:hypothetical protein